MADTTRSRTLVLLLGCIIWLAAWSGQDNLASGQGKPDQPPAADLPKPPSPQPPAPPVLQVKEAAQPSGGRKASPLSLVVSGPGVLTDVSLGSRFQFKIDPKASLADLLPAAPKASRHSRPVLADDLAQVPEVSFQEPLAKSPGALEQTAHMIAKINHLSQKKMDGFMEALMKQRADLAGLPFTLGDACRMKGERSQQFTVALDRLRNLLNMQVNVPVVDAPARAADVFWGQFHANCLQEDKAAEANRAHKGNILAARIAALMQVLAPESPALRRGLVRYLETVPHAEATKALARLAIFSAEEEIRQDALEALKVRREKDYTDILMQGLRYPWPAVAQRASEALVKLERSDVIPQLVAFLDDPDPRAPVVKMIDQKPVPVVRELVRINHHRNCMLCHAPGNAATARLSSADVGAEKMLHAEQKVHAEQLRAQQELRLIEAKTVMLAGEKAAAASADHKLLAEEGLLRARQARDVAMMQLARARLLSGNSLTAQIPIPGEPLPTPSQGYSNSIPDILVRIDVTYVRQDFSVRLRVADAHPWPEMQRFDFLVRSRVLTEPEAKAYREELKKRETDGKSPHHQAVLVALRELTGREAEPTAQAWRRVLDLPEAERPSKAAP